MFGEWERLSRIESEQERALSRYLRREVYAYSRHYATVLDAAGLDRGRIRTTADLSRLPLTRIDELAMAADPGGYVLRPDDARISGYGDPALALRLLWHRVTGRRDDARRLLVDPIFKPLQWLLYDGVRWASTAADIERLGEIGRRWLEHAALRPSDTIVSIVPAGPSADYWQLLLGSRRGGVAIVPLDRYPDQSVVRGSGATVLAGRSADLAALLEPMAERGASLPDLRTVLVVGELLGEDRRGRLAALAAEVGGADPPAVVAAWRPPGARALWTECRGGSGFHTWPATELVEVVDGELVWSPIGWRGTVILRIATGVRVALDPSPCPSCGRTTPRVFVRGSNNGDDGG